MATEQDIYNDIADAQNESDTQAAKIAEAMSLLATKAAGGKNEPLTFSGAVSAVYDGSAPVSVEIPQGGGGDEWEFVGTYTVEQDAVNLYMDFGKVYKKLIITTDSTALALLNESANSIVKYSSGAGGWNNQMYAQIDNSLSRTTWAGTTTLIDFTVKDYPVWIMGAGWQRTQFGNGAVKTNQRGISGCYFTAHDGNKMLNTHVLTVWGVAE